MEKQIVYLVARWDKGILLVRIIVAIFIIKAGFEIIESVIMAGYKKWLTKVKVPFPVIMSYVGKLSEIVCSFLLLIGLFTRIASIILIINMFVITFIMLEGKIFGDNQHPFLFLLLFALFVFVGAGRWSVDYLVFYKKQKKW